MKTLKELLGFDLNYPYSTMTDNGLGQTVIYNGVKCLWGLHELGSPPTLISPRPKIRLKIKYKNSPIKFCNVDKDSDEYTILTETYDFVMHRCIEKELPEDIIEAMFNKEKVFIYEAT